MHSALGNAAVVERTTKSVDEATVLQTLVAIAPAIAQVAGTACEVVVHDLSRPESSIVAIENGHVTNRSVGGPLVGGPIDDQSLGWMSQYGSPNQWNVYMTKSPSGRRMKSTTVLFRNSRSKPFAALCINIDITDIELAGKWLESLASVTTPGDARLGDDDPTDVEGVLDNLIRECTLAKGIDPGALPKQVRTQVVKELDDRGAFLIRGAVRRVANVLGVSKFTIYNDLDVLRNG